MADSRMQLHKHALDQRHPRSHLVEEFIERHGMQLLQTARRYSSTTTDAEDAYQRTLEVLLTKAPEGFDEQRLLAWALTVTRNEALMEQRRNAKLFAGSFEEITAELSDAAAETDEHVLDAERIGQGREALERIRPDQMRCLLLRADGLNYDEIGEVTGFSYAKINRCLSDGRKAFRDHVARLDSGAECRRLAGVLSMMADGVVSSGAQSDAELHLKNCLACQATLRDYRAAPSRAAAYVPLGLLAAAEGKTRAGGLAQRIGDAFESGYASLQERLFGHAATLHQSAELTAAKKLGIVAAVSASLVAGGATVDKFVENNAEHPPAQATKPAPDPGATPLVPTPIEAAPASVPASAQEKPSSDKPAHDATESDTVSKAAGTQVQDPSAPPDPEGVSVPSDPASGPPVDSGVQSQPSRGGSSDPSTGLAP